MVRSRPFLLRLPGLFGLWLVAAGTAQAQIVVHVDHKVKTQAPYGICVDDNYSAIYNAWCDVTSFSPQVPSAVAAGSDPGRSDIGDIFVPFACWMDCSSGQCCMKFDFKFMSLQDLGEWQVSCDGIGADPVWCTGTCTPTCDPASVFDLSVPLVYVVNVWNDPPTASISRSPTPAWNATVTLDANSGDADGGSLTHTWTITGRPAGSTTNLSSTSSETPSLAFDSDDDIGDWSFQVHVDDNEGERKTFAHSFNVPNVPPSITITGPTEIDALENIELGVSPASDVDGGDFDLVWSVTSSPPGASVAPQSNYSTAGSITIPTTDADIGVWTFELKATDNEGDDDTDTHTIEVMNLPPEIDFAGDASIDTGDTISVETTFIEDLDGGDLTFAWDVIQVPSASSTGLQSGLSSTAAISIPTDDSDAGTWVFRLTVTDNEGESVDDTFQVFVDGPVHASIVGTDAISYDMFPLQLVGDASWDSDSDCELDPVNHCHLTESGPPQGLTAGITKFTWYVTDAPSDSPYGTGRVDEVFGIDGTSSTLSFDLLDIPPGEWSFELEVEDPSAEGNVHWVGHTVWILHPNTVPLLNLTPSLRYDTNVGGNLYATVSVQAYAYDLDNLLVGDALLPGVGIDDYHWDIQAPIGCTPPAPPTGSTASVYAPYAAGELVPPECHGPWTVSVTAEDDDSPALTATGATQIIIGNCPTVLCIDYPTTLYPAFVEFVENVDIPIAYHLDSAVYDDPLFASGLFAEVRLYHESNMVMPVYTALDPNLLASNKGAVLFFHWDGWTDARTRPETGYYTIEISLWSGSFGPTGISASEPMAIWIETAQVDVGAGATTFVRRADLVAGTDSIALSYEVVGAVSITDVIVRVRDLGSAVVYEQSMGAASFNTFAWNGNTGGGSFLPSGVYTIEVEANASTGVLGTSQPHEFTVYDLDLVPVTNNLGGTPPEQFVVRNGDDDNKNGTEDHADAGPAPADDDLEQMQLLVAPLGANAQIRLDQASGSGTVAIWENPDKTVPVPLPISWNLLTDVPPGIVYVEGVTSGDVELTIELIDPDAVTVENRNLLAHVVDVDLDLDTNMDGSVTVADDGHETDDKSIVINVNNDADGGGIDSHDNVVNGAPDLAELAQLTLRRMQFVPPGGAIRIEVTDAPSTLLVNVAKNKIRIFDEGQVGRIGPPAADGGPDAHQYVLPPGPISAGDLTWYVECFNHGNVTIRLIVLDSTAMELARDEVKVALNVDRTPAGGATRFRINANHTHATTTIEGVRGRIQTAQAKVNWAPTIRMFSSTNVWFSVQDMGTATGDYWIQTGLAVDRNVGTAPGSETSAVYFESMVHGGAVGEVHHYVLKPGGAGWPADALYSAAVENLATGQVVARVDGVPWDTFTDVEWQTRKVANYQLGSELFHSVDQNPGTAASHAVLSVMEIVEAGVWTATAFVPLDLHITDWDKSGVEFRPAMSHEWAHGAMNAQGVEMWDLVVEY